MLTAIVKKVILKSTGECALAHRIPYKNTKKYVKEKSNFLGNLPIGDEFWIREKGKAIHFRFIDRFEKDGMEIIQAVDDKNITRNFTAAAVYVIEPKIEKGLPF